jgi:hypothetical protein
MLTAASRRKVTTGAARMQVDSLFDRIEALEIDLARDVEEKFIRGSGAGGQKINKTSNNVQLIHLREWSMQWRDAFAPARWSARAPHARAKLTNVDGWQQQEPR